MQQILNRKKIQLNKLKHCSSGPLHSELYVDGRHLKKNMFFDGDGAKIHLILYVDMFEVWNSLGTSKKKHKISAVYWVLANMPPEMQFSLTWIHLSLLSKGDATKNLAMKQFWNHFWKIFVSWNRKRFLFLVLKKKHQRGCAFCCSRQSWCPLS